MGSTKNRAVLLAVAIGVLAVILACSSGGLLAGREEATATPTKTPKPTFTATFTPTLTPLPTDTPTPTETPRPTDTPAPTNTPIIQTATFTPEPTATETPIPPTNTPKPTAKPTAKPKTPTPRPLPTNTPLPQYQWSGQLVWDPNVAPNCAGPNVSRQSVIKDKSGAAVNNARIMLDCYGNQWISLPSGAAGGYEAGHYDFSLGQIEPQDWTCTIQVYDLNGVRVTSSQVVTIVFDKGPCEPGGSGHQVAIVNWTKNY